MLLLHTAWVCTLSSPREDLCLKYTEPEVYKEIAKKLKETKASREKFIQSFIRPIDKGLQDMNFKHVIKGRPKSIYSIHNKLKKSNVPFDEIYDLFAVRVILDVPKEQEKAACWAVYSMVTDHYKPNPDRLKDWISNPNPMVTSHCILL
jgi:GTP pyrophosphokinase